MNAKQKAIIRFREDLGKDGYQDRIVTADTMQEVAAAARGITAHEVEININLTSKDIPSMVGFLIDLQASLEATPRPAVSYHKILHQ